MENRELYERMLSGTMYNDLSTELVQRREQVVFLTNDYNSNLRIWKFHKQGINDKWSI